MTTLTTTNPVVIELPDHNLFTGDRVTINDVVGTAELNGNRYWIKRLSSSTFELYNDLALTSTVDGTAYGIFIAPGTVEKYKIYGALTVRGGAGVERNLIVGETLHAGVAGAESFFYGDVLPVGAVNLGSPANKFNSLYLEGTTLYLSTVTLKSSDSLNFAIDSTAGFVRQTVGDITLTSGKDSTSTTSGSVIVVGGVGIGKTLHVGEIIHADSTLNATSTSSGSIVVAGGAGIARDMWIGGDLYVEGEINAVVTGVSDSAINLAGGEAGSLVYQDAPDSSAFLLIGAPGEVLLSDGENPYWGVPSAAGAMTATNANNIFVNTSTDGTYYIGLTEQIGNYSQIDSDVALTYNSINGELSVEKLAITSDASSTTSTVEQSLVVSGGIGVEKDSYFAEGIYGRDGNPDEDYLVYSPRVTVSPTVPTNPRVGDFWISANAYLQYIQDGTTKFWIQVGTV
jgi:hypothetical protein